MSELALKPRSAFDGLLPSSDATDGLEITDRDGVGLATLVARRGARQMLRARLQSTFGIDLREGPVLSIGEGVLLVGTGADSWLAVSANHRRNFGAQLAGCFFESAAVCDQSDGYGLLRLTGAKAADVLQRLLPIDLHPQAFPIGSAASTITAHIPLLVWRLNEATFEVAVFRSYAASFVHALNEAALPFSRGRALLGRG